MATIQERLSTLWNGVIRGKKPSDQQNINPQTTGAWGTGYSSFGQGSNHPIIQLLDKAENKYQTEDTDPRLNLHVYRMLMRAFPFNQRAVQVHGDMLGELTFESDDQGAANAVREWSEFYRVENQSIQAIPGVQGLDYAMKMMLREGLTDGQQHAETFTDDGTPTGLISGMRFFDSDRFRYHSDDGGINVRLVYDSVMGIKDVLPSVFFQVLKPDASSRHYWGRPLLYGQEFFASQMIRTIIAQADTRLRIANPPMVFNFVPDMDQVRQWQASNASTDFNALLLSARSTFGSKWAEALRQAKESGTPPDITMALPGTKIEAVTYGKDAPGITGFGEETDFYAKLMMLSTKCPMEFLGFDPGGSGQGSGRFDQVMKFMMTFSATNRKLITPITQDQVDLMLLNDAPKWFGKVKAVWKPLTIEDMKAMMDAKAVEITNWQNAIMTYTQALNEFSADERGQEIADAFATSAGYDALIGAGASFTPPLPAGPPTEE